MKIRRKCLLQLCTLPVLLLVLAAAALLCLRYKHRFDAVEGWSQYHAMPSSAGPDEREIKRYFLTGNGSDEDRYDALFRYFLAGALAHISASGARIDYPGEPSLRGFRISGLEGFARTGSLLAAWVASGRPTKMAATGGEPATDLVAFLKRGLLVGTDPTKDDYWGNIHDHDQRQVDVADIARIVWLTRAQIWQTLSLAEQARIAGWLQQALPLSTPDNNWMLFPVTVSAVLRSLHWPVATNEQKRYRDYKKNYLEQGWFADPPNGADFYNAWGISYELFWIDHLDPDFDHAFIAETLKQSADLTAHLISPGGIPIMGRSICYRTAVPVPIIAAQIMAGSANQSGLARHALDVTWRYFIAHDALQDGALTQGYFGDDPRLLDPYSGPGSCHWGLRSLLLAFMAGPQSAFWQAASQPLPIEIGDFHLDLPKLGWMIDGKKQNGHITINIPANHQANHAIEDYGWWQRLLEFIYRRPQRPENHAAKYDNSQYDSADLFFE